MCSFCLNRNFTSFIYPFITLDAYFTTGLTKTLIKISKNFCYVHLSHRFIDFGFLMDVLKF